MVGQLTPAPRPPSIFLPNSPLENNGLSPSATIWSRGRMSPARSGPTGRMAKTHGHFDSHRRFCSLSDDRSPVIWSFQSPPGARNALERAGRLAFCFSSISRSTKKFEAPDGAFPELPCALIINLSLARNRTFFLSKFIA